MDDPPTETFLDIASDAVNNGVPIVVAIDTNSAITLGITLFIALFLAIVVANVLTKAIG